MYVIPTGYLGRCSMSKLGDVFDWAILRRILSLVSPYKKVFWLTVVLVILLSLLAPLRPWLIQYTVDHPIANGDYDGLLTLTAIMVLTLCWRYLPLCLQLCQHLAGASRRGTAAAVVRPPRQMRWFRPYAHQHPHHPHEQRCGDHLRGVFAGVDHRRRCAAGDPLVVMAVTDWKLTLIGLVCTFVAIAGC